MVLYYYNAKLDRVVDGDTIDALVDLGFDTWKHVRIRLNGIDAYESRTRDLKEKEKGLRAKARVEELFGQNQKDLFQCGHPCLVHGLLIDDPGHTRRTTHFPANIDSPHQRLLAKIVQCISASRQCALG